MINHLTQEKMLEERNILVESARIARGKIQPLNQIRAEDFDALILPGGFGAALNLSNIGLKNENATVPKDLQEIIVGFYNLSKPIGAICIAPALLAIVLRNHTKIKVTLGESNDLINKLGATEETCNAQDIVVDEDNRLVTTPAFMLNVPLAQIHKGIKGLVIKVLQMCTNI
ncbi:isoprenoid biosynthesis glyoxalase ElbB [Candidatus Tisiphia endosymbiont of Thecophora atra]|uniref:isoprenoid biosynthesis glyoxalase ElbB n=1 Tax=Candidatus Tisiphia endosymbiont of Thecophora atra TaxID=3066258 RepID=UPI00312C8F80